MDGVRSIRALATQFAFSIRREGETDGSRDAHSGLGGVRVEGRAFLDGLCRCGVLGKESGVSRQEPLMSLCSPFLPPDNPLQGPTMASAEISHKLAKSPSHTPA